MKKPIFFIWFVLLLSGMASLFWYNDWKYRLPTPVPVNYVAIVNNSYILLPDQVNTTDTRPVFLHFFNPDCPCSRFNIKYFKTLVHKYERSARFVIVVMNNASYSARQIQNKFGVNIPISFDTSLAALCGVYATPQAVILNSSHQLYYRGNYNKSRYCTDQETNYAEQALNALLTHKVNIFFNQYALQAYGCQLPKCTK